MNKTHNYIYTPAQSANLMLDYADHLAENPGVPFITPKMRKHIIPARQGEVVTFIGRPGNGKSSLLAAFARYEAERILGRKIAALQDSKTPPEEAVLYVTHEQTVETQEVFFHANNNFSISDFAWGRVNKNDIIAANRRRIELPIWIAGRSFKDAGKRIDPMYIDTLFRNIESINADHGVQLTAVFLDYLQLIPTRKKGERHREVAEAILGTTDLAKSVGCPVFLAVQAKDTVDQRGDKIPSMGDTYYTSELDHAADKQFGLLKPSKYWPLGSIQDICGIEMETTNETFMMKMFKQRGDQGARIFPLWFQMETLTLRDMDISGLDT